MEKLGKLLYFGAIVAILYYLFPFFLPFILALILAVLFEPFILFILRKTPIPRKWIVLSVYTGFFGALFSALYVSFSNIVTETISIAKELPNEINTFVEKNRFFSDFYNSLSDDNKEYLNKSIASLVDKSTTFLTSYAGGIFDVIKGFPIIFIAFVVFIVAVYIIALQLPHLKQAFLKYFEQGDSQKKVEIVLSKLHKAVIGVLRAIIILCIMTFIMSLIGLSIIKVKYILLFSLIVTLADLIPIFGSAIILFPWACYLFAVGQIGQGVGLIILFVVITVVKRTAEPKLLADSLGIQPLITLISMYVGLELVGFIGMILGPALIIIIKALEEADLLKFRIKI